MPDLHLSPPPKARRFYEPSTFKAWHGGRASTKSWSAADAALLRTFNGEFNRILCLREFQNSIEDSSFQLLKDRAEHLDLRWRGRPFFTWTKNEIKGINGSRFRFAGLRHNLNSIRSKEAFDLAMVEEAQAASQESIDVLIPTVLRNAGAEIWFMWNPDDPDDPVDAMFRGKAGPPPNSIVEEVNYPDNPYLTDEIRAQIAYDYKRDPLVADHIWRGKYLIRKDAQVFKNWTIEECAPPDDAELLYGGDFGFGDVDPTVGIRCWLVEGKAGRKTLYIDHEVWGMKVRLDDLAAFFAGSDPLAIDDRPARWENELSYAGMPGALDWVWRMDSSQPHVIQHLQSRGLSVQGAKKGAGSIKAGVDWLQSYDIVVHPRCLRTIAEFKGYRYKVDRAGNVLPQIVDVNNHLMDSLRYAVESHRRKNVIF